MRGSGMEDVIFSAPIRGRRAIAEVVLMLDNSDRQATPEFNDSDALEVVRRIERDAGRPIALMAAMCGPVMCS